MINNKCLEGAGRGLCYQDVGVVLFLVPLQYVLCSWKVGEGSGHRVPLRTSNSL